MNNGYARILNFFWHKCLFKIIGGIVMHEIYLHIYKGREGTFDCKLRGYPKFYNRVYSFVFSK